MIITAELKENESNMEKGPVKYCKNACDPGFEAR